MHIYLVFNLILPRLLMRSRQTTEKCADAMTLKQSIKTLWPYITKFKGRVFIALLALIGAKGATLLMPWALKEIIDSVDKSINPILVFSYSRVITAYVWWT